MENSSKIEHLVDNWYSKNSGAWHRPFDSWKTHPNIDKFSRNRSSSCPDILQKLNRNPQKIDGWVFQKSVLLMPRKTKISGKFLDEFSRICQLGLRIHYRDRAWITLVMTNSIRDIIFIFSFHTIDFNFIFSKHANKSI